MDKLIRTMMWMLFISLNDKGFHSCKTIIYIDIHNNIFLKEEI